MAEVVLQSELPVHLPEDSKFILYTDSSGANNLVLQIFDQDDRDLAWQAPDASDEDFEWLCRAVANYHSKPLEIVETDD
jgi:hypothetical protein